MLIFSNVISRERLSVEWNGQKVGPQGYVVCTGYVECLLLKVILMQFAGCVIFSNLVSRKWLIVEQYGHAQNWIAGARMLSIQDTFDCLVIKVILRSFTECMIFSNLESGKVMVLERKLTNNWVLGLYGVYRVLRRLSFQYRTEAVRCTYDF